LETLGLQVSTPELVYEDLPESVYNGEHYAGDPFDIDPGPGTDVSPGSAVRPRVVADPAPNSARRCEPSSPELVGPLVDPYTEIDSFPSAEGQNGVMHLLFGTADRGYRHIKEGHGWGTVDRAETEAALLTRPFHRRDGSLQYVVDVPDRNGVACIRVVSVRPNLQAGDPRRKDVLNSYGAERP
jgi:hypothetical protein